MGDSNRFISAFSKFSSELDEKRRKKKENNEEDQLQSINAELDKLKTDYNSIFVAEKKETSPPTISEEEYHKLLELENTGHHEDAVQILEDAKRKLQVVHTEFETLKTKLHTLPQNEKVSELIMELERKSNVVTKEINRFNKIEKSLHGKKTSLYHDFVSFLSGDE